MNSRTARAVRQRYLVLGWMDRWMDRWMKFDRTSVLSSAGPGLVNVDF